MSLSLSRLRLGLGMPVSGGAAAFDPATLFGSGEEGAWYEPSPTTCFTDTAGTTAAGVGDAVARINDLSGTGNHATQATAAARPILRQTAGGLYYLACDGVDDSLNNLSPVGLTTPFAGVSSFVAGQADTTGSRGIFGASNAALSNDEKSILFRPAGSTSAPNDGTGAILYSFGVAANTPFVTSILSDSTNTKFRLDGADVFTGSGLSNSFAFSDNISIGRSDDDVAGQYWDGHFYAAILVNRRLTPQEISDTESYLASKSGVTL